MREYCEKGRGDEADLFNDALKRLIQQYEQRSDVTFCSFLKKRGMTAIAVRASSMRQQSCVKDEAAAQEAASQAADDDDLMDAD